MEKDFFRSGYSFIFIILIFASSCGKTEVADEVVINQAFSLPLGERIMNIEPPSGISSTPGIHGTFYYMGRPYQINTLYFQKEEQVDFNIDNPNHIKWLQRVDFILKLENGFPVNSYFQIYLLNAARQITDSVFVEGKQLMEAGKINSLYEVQETSITLAESNFEGDRLSRLKAATFLSYKMYLETSREDGAPLYFTNKSDIKVNMAMRLFLKYNLNEI